MDRLGEIFKRQKTYCESLESIYLHNDFPAQADPFPWRLDSRHYQEGFRLLAWRMTEEIVEAVQLHYECFDLVPDDYELKFQEEIADALHFFVELCLATDITPAMLTQELREGCIDLLSEVFDFCGDSLNETIPQRWAFVTYKLGIAMHELRQRPWRTDNRPTDRVAFEAGMTATFLTFISACKRSGIDADALYDAYFAKSKINEDRRQSQLPKSECSVEGEEDDQGDVP